MIPLSRLPGYFIALFLFVASDLYSQTPSQQLKSADAALNAYYKIAIRNASRSRSLTEKFRVSQRHWITFRDANAKFIKGLTNNNRNAVTKTLAIDTTDRAKAIENWFVQNHSMPNDSSQSKLTDADKQLNGTYQNLLKLLNASNTDNLKNAQRTWVAFRDSDLAFQRAYGTVESREAKFYSLSSITAKRTAYLQSIADVIQKAMIGNTTAPANQDSNQVGPPALASLPLHSSQPSPLVLPSVSPEKGIIPRVVSPIQYTRLILDMKENLLVGSANGVVDFWDVQTGSLIRRVNTPSRGWRRAFSNLGNGYVLLASQGRYEGLVQILHRDSDEPLFSDDKNPDRTSFLIESGDMTSPAFGQFVHMGHFGENHRGIHRIGLKGPAISFEKAYDYNTLNTWGIAADASQILLDVGEAGGQEAAPGGKLLWYSLEDGSLRGSHFMPESTELAEAICSANGSDQFFLLANEKLLRFGAKEGLISEEIDQIPDDHELISDGKTTKKNMRTSLLCGTDNGWCVYGFRKAVATDHTASAERKSYSRFAASKEAPDSVRQTVQNWKDYYTITVDRGGEFAATCLHDGKVELHHLSTGRVVRTFGGPVAQEKASFSSLGSQLTTLETDAAGDAHLRITDFQNLTEQRISLPGTDRPVERAMMNPAGQVHLFGDSHWPHDFENVLPKLDPESNSTAPTRVQLAPHGFASGNDFLIENGILEGAAQGVVKRSSSGEVVARFPHASLPESSSLICYHSGLNKGLIANREGVVVLGESGQANSKAPRWDNFVEKSTLGQLNSLRFNHSGNRAVGFRSYKFEGILRMLDLTSPGREIWNLHAGTEIMAFTPDDRYLLINDELTTEITGHLRLLDANTGKERASYEYVGTCIAANEDASRAYIQSAKGGIQIIDLKGTTFVEVARYLPNPDGSYAIILSSGHYLTNGNAMSSISFAIGGRSQPAESYDLKFNRPDLVARALGADETLIRAFEQAHQKRLKRFGIEDAVFAGNVSPPQVEIDYSSIPFTTNERTLKISLTASKGSSPLTALELAINDVPLFGQDGMALTGQDMDQFDGALEIELGEGDNKISVSARDAIGLTSSRVTVNVSRQDSEPALPNLFVLTIGIDDYIGEDHDLALAGKDATDIKNAFEETAGETFGEVRTLTLKDGDATRAGILEKAGPFLQQSNVDDQIVLFIAGHGVLDSDFEYRFCCADLDVERIPETTLSYRELESLFDGCRARKRIVMLDTCHAGEADPDDERLANVGIVPNENVRSVPFQPIVLTNPKSGDIRVTELLQNHFVDLRLGVGAAVLASSSAHQAALETEEVQNGLFTASVIKGLKGEATDTNKDNFLSVSELLNYCKEEVRRMSGNLQDPIARHLNLSRDFTVTAFQ